MCYISKTGLAAAIVAVCGALFADKYELKLELSGSDSIDWSDAASYTGSHSSGPSSGDTVYIPDGMTVKVTAGTASWTSLNNIPKVIPVAGSVLEINVPDSYEGAAVLQTPISGIDIGGIDRIGKLIKKGGGVLEFASYGKVVYNKVIYDYYVNIDVEEGCLKLYANGQSSTEAFFHGAVNVAENAMLKICNVGYTYIAELNGAGRVTLDNTQAQRIYLNGTGPSSYSGFMDGNIRVDITKGRHDIIGAENTFDGSVCLSGSAVCGYTKMGMYNKSGSVGKGNFNFSGTSGIVYLGTEDDISDKSLWLSQNAFIDSGEHGGLTFLGKMSYSGETGMRILTLRGSNADNPCIIAGTFPLKSAEDGTVMYIKKAGTGTWRFAGCDKDRSSLGVIDVQEGTLQFESIAEKGVLCSLGYSTNLYNGVTTFESARKVNYAFVLGKENALGTMEYTGTEAARCSTRPMAIRNKGRFISDSAPYFLENVYALGSGERTLTLAGSANHENAATGLSDGTDGGRLSLEKEGTGTWKLMQPTTFTGPVIARGGVMRIDNSKDRKYRWFRMCFTENGYGSSRYDTYLSYGTNKYGVVRTPPDTEKCTIQLLELALYDSEGNNLLNGFTSGEPNAIARYDYNSYYASQEPGTVVLGTTGAYEFNPKNGQLYNLFDGSNSKMAGYSTSSPTGITVDNPDSWMKLVVRLPDDAPEAVRVDFASALGTNATMASYNGRIATAFRLDGSVDGANWDLGIAQDDALVAPASSGKWHSDPNGNSGGYGKRPGKGFEITKVTPDASYSHSFTCVGASNGGVIDIVGNPYTVSGLVVDASASAGAISNVVFATEGTVYIENVVDMNADSVSLPGDYSHLDGVENLSNWEFLVDGESFINRMLTVENGKLCLRKRGLRVIFR